MSHDRPHGWLLSDRPVGLGNAPQGGIVSAAGSLLEPPGGNPEETVPGLDVLLGPVAKDQEGFPPPFSHDGWIEIGWIRGRSVGHDVVVGTRGLVDGVGEAPPVGLPVAEVVDRPCRYFVAISIEMSEC